MRATFSLGMIRNCWPEASSVLIISARAVEIHFSSDLLERLRKPSTAIDLRAFAGETTSLGAWRRKRGSDRPRPIASAINVRAAAFHFRLLHQGTMPVARCSFCRSLATSREEL